MLKFKIALMMSFFCSTPMEFLVIIIKELEEKGLYLNEVELLKTFEKAGIDVNRRSSLGLLTENEMLVLAKIVFEFKSTHEATRVEDLRKLDKENDYIKIDDNDELYITKEKITSPTSDVLKDLSLLEATITNRELMDSNFRLRLNCEIVVRLLEVLLE